MPKVAYNYTLQNLGNPPFFIVLYIYYCIGWEGFHTIVYIYSLKPEEALIYLYNGHMVGMSQLGSIQAVAGKSMVLQTAACEDNSTMHMTIVAFSEQCVASM